MSRVRPVLLLCVAAGACGPAQAGAVARDAHTAGAVTGTRASVGGAAQGRAVTRLVPRAARRIRGRTGYGRRYTRPTPLPPETLRRIREELEAEEEHQRPAVSRGPFPGPRGAPVDESGFRFPFRPGRRSDDAEVPLPPWPARGAPASRRGTVQASSAHATGIVPVGRGDPEDFAFFRNQPVIQRSDGSGVTNTPGEPTWANDGDVILYAGNTHAHVSEDGGITWDDLAVVDTQADRPNVDGGFAGDSVVYAVDYEPPFASSPRGPRRLVFWTMMYFHDGQDNTIRLQVFHGGDEVVSQVGQCTYDFKASQMGVSGDAWIDQPRVASTDRYLYLMAPVYHPRDTADPDDDWYLTSRIWRVELAELAETDCEAEPLTYAYYPNTAGASDVEPTPVQGADDVMYWAYLDLDAEGGRVLRVWRHEDDEEAARLTTHPITPYLTTWSGLAHCETPGPTVTNPCASINSTLSPETGWIGADDFGWIWHVAEGEGFEFPHIKVARFRNGGDRELIDEPDVRNSLYAWAWGGVGVNERGHLGLVAYSVGGEGTAARNPSPSATLVDDVDPDWDSQAMDRIITGADGTVEDRWGDYTTVRAYDGCPNLFGTAVASMQERDGLIGATADFQEHRFAIFGRVRDACGDLEPLAAEWLPALVTRTGAQGAGTSFHSVREDEEIHIRTAIRNVGPGRTAASATGWRLSRDLRASPDDVELRADVTAVPSLDAGHGAGLVARAPVPRGTAGSYHLLVCSQAAAGERQVTERNDCVAARTSVFVARSSREAGVAGIRLPQPRGVAETPLHAVPLRGRVRIEAQVVARRRPRGGRRVQVRLSPDARPSRRSRAAGTLRARSAGGVAPDGTRRFVARGTLRLPRGLARGRRYHVLACAVRRRGARPRTGHCLPARQQVLVKRRR